MPFAFEPEAFALVGLGLDPICRDQEGAAIELVDVFVVRRLSASAECIVWTTTKEVEGAC